MGIYTCCICGKQFEHKSNTVICSDCKRGKCVICGKEFIRIYPYTQKTCSSKCRGVYRAQSGIGKQIGAKMKQTKMERYGTLDPTAVSVAKQGKPLSIKICPICGKEFTPDTNRQVYCKDKHYGPCPVCGKLTEIKDLYLGPQACSEKCRIARINATCLERYGNKDAVNSDHAKQLAKIHSMERYGTEFPMQNPKIKAKAEASMIAKYGVPNAMQNPEILKKAQQTNLERYGTKCTFQSEEIKAKSKATVMEHYGGFGLASPELRERIIATNREKYGVDFSTERPGFSDQVKQTMLNKYGYENYQQSRESKLQSMADPTKVDNWLQFTKNPAQYIEKHYDNAPGIYVLCSDLGVTDTTIYDVLVKNECSHLINHSKQSSIEYMLIRFLKQFIPEHRIILNSRKIISPLEIDLWLPDYNIGIECNPTATHNSSIKDPWGADPKAPSYHKHKTDEASKAGVFLFHIFGYEWTARRPVIESMIRNLLGKNENVIYARNTEVRKVSGKEAMEFLNNNHRQGAASVSMYYGLYTKDNQLVSVMSFNKMRPQMGKIDDSDETYELSRFCNILNTSVVGGASKLLKHFINEHRPKKIISFSDRAHTRGNLYTTLGFHEVSMSDPGYVWVKLADDSYYHRSSCQKSNLRNLFKDPSIDIENKTEREIMIEHGYVQVFDSGVIRWEFDVR